MEGLSSVHLWVLIGTVFTAWISTIGYVMRLVLKGELIPRLAHEEVVQDREKWEKAWHIQSAALAETQATSRERDAQFKELLKAVQATEKVLNAILNAVGVK